MKLVDRLGKCRCRKNIEGKLSYTKATYTSKVSATYLRQANRVDMEL